MIDFPDPENPSRSLVDMILDKVGQKGTGKWTIKAALDLGVPIPTITAAVDARGISSHQGRAHRRVKAAHRPQARSDQGRSSRQFINDV